VPDIVVVSIAEPIGPAPPRAASQIIISYWSEPVEVEVNISKDTSATMDDPV
jgi:hypothetical protein